MTRAKYASAEERTAALSRQAKAQMKAQWERQRQDTGQPLGYFGGHRRVRQARGPAKERTCPCGKQAQHWALIHGEDGTEPMHYKAMCVPCHFAYDGVAEKQRESQTHEARSEAARRAWVTRRANAAAASGRR